MLKVRTAVANGTLERDYAVAENAGHDRPVSTSRLTPSFERFRA